MHLTNYLLKLNLYFGSQHKMFFSTFEELTLMDNTSIESEIVKLKSELVQLRLQKSTKQSFKPHLFKSLKRKVAQLLTIETQRKLKI